jgi:hypothetical protein
MAGYTYDGVLETAQRVNWKIADIIGDDKRLDFAKPFMLESLAGVRQLDFLSPTEQRTLNQIRGLGYLVMFGLVEEFILPFVLDHANDFAKSSMRASATAAKSLDLRMRWPRRCCPTAHWRWRC